MASPRDALPSVKVKELTVIVWPLVIVVLSGDISPVPCPTHPCILQVVPAVSLMRKWAAVPPALAVALHVPSFVFWPEAAAFIQSLGSAMVQRSEPLSAVAQSAGWVPVLI